MFSTFFLHHADLFPECSSPDPVPSPTIFSYNNLQSVVEGTDGKNAQFAAPPGLHAGKNADVYTVKKVRNWKADTHSMYIIFLKAICNPMLTLNRVLVLILCDR